MMGNGDTHLYVMGFPDGPLKVGSSSNLEQRVTYIRRDEADPRIALLEAVPVDPRWALAAERLRIGC
jgi:hypothetical protein